MDPLRSTSPAEALSDAERDARIEQLLLAGLDEYFASSYEQAINLWTRVLFLDRNHDRARAYIERARSAQAELLRETEAVLHQGIAAFHEGDVARARQLVADALDRGASRDDAQGMLERIERLGIGQTAPARRRRSLPLPAPDPDARLAAASQTGLRRVRGRMAAVLLLVAALGVLAVGLLGFTVPESWTLAGLSTASSGPSSTVVSTTPEPLPVPRASEAFLSRGRALLATGRLRDALDQIDRIPIGDPLRADADRLRAAVQRELLAVAAAEQPATATPDALPALRPPE